MKTKTRTEMKMKMEVVAMVLPMVTVSNVGRRTGIRRREEQRKKYVYGCTGV